MGISYFPGPGAPLYFLSSGTEWGSYMFTDMYFLGIGNLNGYVPESLSFSVKSKPFIWSYEFGAGSFAAYYSFFAIVLLSA